MDFNKFSELLKENFVDPMNGFYRDRYKRIFNEEPPEDNRVMMERMINHGNEQIKQIIEIKPRPIE